MVSLAVVHESELRLREQTFAAKRENIESSAREAAAASEAALRDAHAAALQELGQLRERERAELIDRHESELNALKHAHALVRTADAEAHAVELRDTKANTDKHFAAQLEIWEARHKELEARIQASKLDLEHARNEAARTTQRNAEQEAELARRALAYESLQEQLQHSLAILASTADQMAEAAKRTL
jgi:hypothetical protein